LARHLERRGAQKEHEGRQKPETNKREYTIQKRISFPFTVFDGYDASEV
jgi:hypothetical protein